MNARLNTVRRGFPVLIPVMVAATIAVFGGAVEARTPFAASQRGAHVTQPTAPTRLFGTSAGRTSTGVALSVAVDIVQFAKKTELFSVTLAAGKLSPIGMRETHAWTFELPGSVLRTSEAKGTATLTLGGHLEPYGTLELNFMSSSIDRCRGGETQVGRLSGSFYLDTKSRAWGTVGNSNTAVVSFDSRNADLIYGESYCPSSPAPLAAPCFSGISWDTTGNGTIVGGDWFAVGDYVYEDITGSRLVGLQKPADAGRTDAMEVPAASATYSNGTVSVAASPGSRALTGSGTISLLGQPHTYPGKWASCMNDSKKTIQYWAKYYDLPWSNGHRPLTFHMAVGGNLSIPNNPKAEVDFGSF